MNGPDASNSCLPAGHPVRVSIPPVPRPVRGDRCALTGHLAKNNGSSSSDSRHVLSYASGKLVVSRVLPTDATTNTTVALVYRAHAAAVTAVTPSPSNCYMASGDAHGRVKVWALDHEEHLCRYETLLLSGPLRDIAWDGESKRLCVVGDRAPTDRSGACAKCVQWDTGVSVGVLGVHLQGRAASCAAKPSRPFRMVTSGRDDGKVQWHAGPPFAKMPVNEQKVPSELAHGSKGGAVHCVRYHPKGTVCVSVHSGKSVMVYHGKTGALVQSMDGVHGATIYACAWKADGSQLLTCSGDGTCQSFVYDDGADLENGPTTVLTKASEWKVAHHQAHSPAVADAWTKVPAGGAQVGCTFYDQIPVSVSLNGQLSVLDPNGGTVTKVVAGHSAPVAAVAYSNKDGGSVCYTGDTDGVVCEWSMGGASIECQRRLEPVDADGQPANNDLMYVLHTGAVSGVACLGDDVVVSVGWDDVLHVAVKGVVQGTTIPLGGQPTAVASGTSVAVVATTAGLRVVTTKGNAVVSVGDLVSISYEALCVTMSPDDTTVYVGGSDSLIHVYTVDSGSSTLTPSASHETLAGHLKAVHALALSHDGTKLASGDLKDVLVWNVADKYTPIVGRGKWCFHTQRITCLAWSLDDAILASGGADDSIYLWNPESKMRRVHYGYCHRGGLVSLHFQSDFELVSVGVDSVVNLWDASADVQKKFG